MFKYLFCLLISCSILADPVFPTDIVRAQTLDEIVDLNLNLVKGSVTAFIWINPDCPFIKRHDKQKSFFKLLKKYQSQSVKIYFVNSTYFHTSENSQKWIEENQIFTPVIIDQDGNLGKNFAAKTTPHAFVFNKQQQLIYQGAFDSDSSGEAASQIPYLELAIDAALADKLPETVNTKPYGCSVKYKD